MAEPWRIDKPGVFVFDGGCCYITNWHFNLGGQHMPQGHEVTRQSLRAVLLYLADRNGIRLVDNDPAERFDPTTERAALDAITVARWPAQPEGEQR